MLSSSIDLKLMLLERFCNVVFHVSSFRVSISLLMTLVVEQMIMYSLFREVTSGENEGIVTLIEATGA